MEKKNNRIHRVGTLTFGFMLILYGVLFLVSLLFPALHYEMIFRLWPVVLIFLGLEVLLGNSRRDREFIYDKTAIVLTVLLTLFAFVMAMADISIQHASFCGY